MATLPPPSQFTLVPPGIQYFKIKGGVVFLVGDRVGIQGQPGMQMPVARMTIAWCDDYLVLDTAPTNILYKIYIDEKGALQYKPIMDLGAWIPKSLLDGVVYFDAQGQISRLSLETGVSQVDFDGGIQAVRAFEQRMNWGPGPPKLVVYAQTYSLYLYWTTRGPLPHSNQILLVPGHDWRQAVSIGYIQDPLYAFIPGVDCVWVVQNEAAEKWSTAAGGQGRSLRRLSVCGHCGRYVLRSPMRVVADGALLQAEPGNQTLYLQDLLESKMLAEKQMKLGQYRSRWIPTDLTGLRWKEVDRETFISFVSGISRVNKAALQGEPMLNKGALVLGKDVTQLIRALAGEAPSLTGVANVFTPAEEEQALAGLVHAMEV